MSAAALATVQSLYAAFARGDVMSMLELMTDDAVWHFIGDREAPYTGRFEGRARIGEWFGRVAQVDLIQSFEPREFLVGPDHVTVLGRERTTSRASGKVFECDWVHVFRIRGARVVSFWGMLDTEAVAAARQ